MKKASIALITAGMLIAGSAYAKQDVTNWSKSLPEGANGNLTPAGQAVYNQGQYNKLVNELGSEAAAQDYLLNLPEGYELKFNFPASKESPLP